MPRGNRREAVFHDDDDRRFFLAVYDLDESSSVSLPSGANISGSGNLSASAGSIVFNGDITQGGALSFAINISGELSRNHGERDYRPAQAERLAKERKSGKSTPRR